jgi:adenine deaminase
MEVVKSIITMKEISIGELITKLEERRVFHYGISLYTNDGSKYWIYADDEGVLSLNKMLKNFYENTNLNINEAIHLASLNPAKSINIDQNKGSLEIGKDADIAIFDNNFDCYMTIVNGEIVFKQM